MASRLNSFISLLVFATGSISFSSCNNFDEPGTGIPIRMNVVADHDSISTRDITEVHVAAFFRDKKCGEASFLFEEDASLSSSGSISWSRTHEWPVGLVSFVVYWPADSHVDIDEQGNVSGGNYVLIGKTEPLLPDKNTISVSLQYNIALD